MLNTAAGSGGPSGCATGAAFLNATATISYIEDTTCQGYAKPPWQTGIFETSAPSTCKFYDITQGDNDVTCQFNSTFHADCYLPAGTTNGTLGTQAISSLTLKAGGSGYTSKPTCTISLEPNKSKYSSPTGAAIYAPRVRATCTATINATTGKVALPLVGTWPPVLAASMRIIW